MPRKNKDFHALVVDDDPNIRRVVSRALRGVGFTCDTAPDGELARQHLVMKRTHLLVTDLRMPVRHGHRLVVEVFERRNPPMVVVITGLVEPSIASDLIMRGVADLVLKPFDAGLCAAKWLAMLRYREENSSDLPALPGAPELAGESAGQEEVAQRLAVTAETLRGQLREITRSFETTIDDLERKHESLSAGFLGSIRLLTQLMRQFDGAESTHSARVERLAEGICDCVRVSREQLRTIRLASLLHDLGQFGMPDSVRVTAPEAMTPSQWEAYQRYPEIGATLLSEVAGCEHVVDLVMAHTEAFDGSGFPKRLAGDEIPLGARIVRLADGVDTFLMYNAGPEVERRLAEHLFAERGHIYDPDILDVSMEFILHALAKAKSCLCGVEDLCVGDTLEEDLLSPQGHIIARRGAQVNETMKTYVRRIMGNVEIRIQRAE